MWIATGFLRNFLVLTLALFAAAACVQVDAARKRFDIASQPAAAALSEFARQADITLIFSYDLVAGAKSRPLKGDYTVDDGLTLLLAGTGLGYQQAGEDTFFICSPSSCGTRSPPATQAEQKQIPDGGKRRRARPNSKPVTQRRRPEHTWGGNMQGNPVASKIRRNVLRNALVVALAAGSAMTSVAHAQDQVRSFDVPAQPAASGLNAFAEQADITLVFSQDLASGVNVNSLKGDYPIEAGLARMLEGTGLRYAVGTDGAIVIRAEGDDGQESPSAGDAGTASSSEDGDAPNVEITEFERIVVTGTNIRGADVAAPTITMTREEIANTGYSTVEELFESLPQNFDEITPEGRFANEGGSQLRGQNNSRVTSVDLRGLGAQSTLTLLNGTRRAGSIGGRVVDISVIPLSIIDRVEVVTGGRSAIYGADAVAGVVNLVTRRDFDGAESQVYLGAAGNGGGERLVLSQMFGATSERGGFLAAYDFAREWPLDLADVGLLSFVRHPAVPLTQLSQNAQVNMRRHTGFLSGYYALSDRVEIFGDALYSTKKYDDFQRRTFFDATQESTTDIRNKAEHLSVSGGARIDLGSDWSLKLAGGWSSAKNENATSLFVDFGFFSFEDSLFEVSDPELTTVSAIVDGPLFSIGSITPRVALGVESRREEYKLSFDGVEQDDDDRTVRSIFGEVLIPLVEDSDTTGMRRLEVMIAGRYDDYSDFGDTFNPQIGVSWEPFRGLTLLGSYSTAFRAPALVELGSSADVFIEAATDPTQGGASVPILFSQGQTADLGPEEAKTWSVGFDYKPTFAPWFKASMSYFDVHYDGRIEQPSINADRMLVLERASRFPGLIIRNPTAEQVAAVLDLDADGIIDSDFGVPFDPATQNLLDVFPNIILFDNRTRNVAVEEVRGLDLTIDTEFDTRFGKWNFGGNLTHTLDHNRRVTASSPAFSLLNEVGKPVDTRARSTAGWTRGAYSAFAYVNYVDDYANPFSTPPSRMGSWTTVDLTLRFNGSELADRGFLKGFDATFSVRNLFDKEPPAFHNSLLGILYDASNADPFGRFFSLRLTKRW